MVLNEIWFTSKLALFSRDQRIVLVSAVTQAIYDAFSATQKAMFKLLMSYLDGNSSQASINSVYDYCREVFIEGKGPYIFVINQGEDGKITETRANGTAQYSGYMVVREDSTNQRVTDPVQVSENANDYTHDLPYTNFSLTKGGIYRLRVQLEKNLSGDASMLLSTAYVIVPMRVDQISASHVVGILTNATPP